MADPSTSRSGHDGEYGHSHDQGHDHSHTGGSTRSLALVATINLVGFVAELAGGLLFGSVALLSDAVHMLFDALAYVMAFGASYIAGSYEGSERWSYGLHRLEPLSAFLNGVLLVPMVIYILYASYQRFLDPIAISTGPTLAIAVGGLVVNLASVYVIEGETMSLNERGAFYHLLGDAGGSVAVIVSVLVVQYTGVRLLDPITAVLIAVLVVWSAGKLLWGSGSIFLQRTPFDALAVRETLADLEGVDGVRDFHAWQICSEITVATVHVETATRTVEETDRITRAVHETLAEHGVDHATVECCPRDDSRSRAHLDAHTH
jgi:cobalt-zinc-cadmium efflux system protein